MWLQYFPAGPIDTNTVIVGCLKTHKAVIIDVPAESASAILELLSLHHLQAEKILLTHSHWDHIGDMAVLKKKLDVPVHVHAEDAGNVREPGSDGLPLFFPIEGVQPDGFLQEGQEMSVGELEFQVIHTPGHTPGCVCFWFPQEKVLISGDTLFQGSIGRLDLPTARPKLMWDSLKKLAQLPATTKVIPGHGRETTIGAESWLSHAEQYFGG